MTAVKVCGLTRAADVATATQLGAAFLGFILTPSPRQISPRRAAELAAATCGRLCVGVFTTESPAAIAADLEAAGLDAIQLAAGGDGPSVAAVRAAAADRGLRPRVIAAADTPDADGADYIILDARRPGVYGGTGEALDWTVIAAGPLPARERFFLAGGLTPENVPAALAALRPAVVDVNSGVESTPGVKNPVRLADFFRAVAHADLLRGSTL